MTVMFRIKQFYVNGYQFGKYVNHIGPQKVFPVRKFAVHMHRHEGRN